jgi:glycosyltransferase involved in cell wall biosynthesis
MRIAMVTALFPPEFSGGTERVTLAHARALVNLGHDVRIISGTAGDAPVGASLVEGLPVHRIERPHDANPLVADEQLRLCVADAVRNVDVIHVQHNWTFGAGLGPALSKIAPVVLSLHDFSVVCPRFFRVPQHDAKCPDGNVVAADELHGCVQCVAPDLGGDEASVQARLFDRLEAWRADLNAAARILVPSRTHLVRLIDLIDLDGKARIAQPGVCHDFTGEVPRPKPWDGTGPLRILHPGRRSLAKGTIDLVRAVVALPEGSVELLCLGGAEPGLDRRLMGMAGNTAIRLEGAYDSLDLEQAASACHLAALPSRLPESYALTVDEALALGLPVWASSADAARERFGEGSLRVLPAEDPSAWTHALHGLLEHPDELIDAFESLPESIPNANDAALELLQFYEQLVPRSDIGAGPTQRAG